MGLWQKITQQKRSRLGNQPLKSWRVAGAVKRWMSWFLLGVSLTVAIAACSGGNNNTANTATNPGNSTSGKKDNVELLLVSYAVTQAAYEKIIPPFVAKWKQEKGQTVTFKQSYGGSGSQTRAVIDGLEADIVALSLASDTKKIEKAGLIQPGWEKEAPNEAIVTKSVDALVTRNGNPKGIKTWEDLAKDGVKVVAANPKTSGGARWSFLGVWGSVAKTGGDATKAQAFAAKVYKNAPVLPKDGREATDAFFKQGQGDVLITYENEAILAGQKGGKLPYVVPNVNISIENPVAVVDKNVDKHGNREVAEAFVKYLFTPEAQREFSKVGFRPVDPTVEKEVSSQFPTVKTLFTVKDLGGWEEVQKKLFDEGGVFDQIQAKS